MDKFVTNLVKNVKSNDYGIINFKDEIFPQNMMNVYRYFTYSNDKNGLNKKYTIDYRLNIKKGKGIYQLKNINDIKKHIVLNEDIKGEYFNLVSNSSGDWSSYSGNGISVTNLKGDGGLLGDEYIYQMIINIHLSDRVELHLIYEKKLSDNIDNKSTKNNLNLLLQSPEKNKIQFKILKDITESEVESLKLGLQNCLLFYYNLENGNMINKIDNFESVQKQIIKLIGGNDELNKYLNLGVSGDNYLSVNDLSKFNNENNGTGQLYEIGSSFGLMYIEKNGSTYLIDYNRKMRYLGDETDSNKKEKLFLIYEKRLVNENLNKNMIFVVDIIGKAKIEDLSPFECCDNINILLPISGKNIHRISNELLNSIKDRKIGILFTNSKKEYRIWSPIKTMKFLCHKRKNSKGGDIIRSVIDPRNGNLLEFKELELKVSNKDNIPVNFSLNDSIKNSLFGYANAIIDYRKAIIFTDFNGRLNKIQHGMVVDCVYQGFRKQYSLWKPMNIDWYNTFNYQKGTFYGENIEASRKRMIPIFENISEEALITGNSIPNAITIAKLGERDLESNKGDNELVNEAVVEMIETQLEDNQETYQQLLKPVIDKVDDDDLDKIISYFNPELIVESIQSKIMDNERELLAFGIKSYNLPDGISNDLGDENEEEQKLHEVLSRTNKLIYPKYEIAVKYNGRKVLEKIMRSKYDWSMAISYFNLGYVFESSNNLRIFLQNMNDSIEDGGKMVVVFLEGRLLFEIMKDDYENTISGIKLSGKPKWTIKRDYDTMSFGVKNAFGQKILVEHQNYDLLKDQYLVQTEVFEKYCHEYGFKLEKNFMLHEKENDNVERFLTLLRCQIYTKEEDANTKLLKKID